MVKKILLIGTPLVATLLLSSCSASTDRSIKDMQSEYGGGLHRTLDVYQYGKLVKHYEGKFDIQKTGSKIKFITPDNKVHIIYAGNDTTVITDEN